MTMDSAAKDACILVVEDEYLIAVALEAEIAAYGFRVAGPYERSFGAVRALRKPIPITAGILDFNLGQLTSAPVARVLQARGLPFVFTSGGNSPAMKEEFPHVPIFLKPYDVGKILSFLGSC